MTQTRQPIGWALGLLLLIELLILYRLQGPSAKPADASLDDFSAARAVSALTRVLGDESPHPTGSAANDRVRDRLVTELRDLGLKVEVQVSHRPAANLPLLRNVLARLPHTPDSGRPLVLATHYDSVAAGPGAADAGSCVAALLETARALQRGAPHRRPVYLLITDGEEAGLKGAARFVQEQALAREKPFVLNFDARGTSGPSLMYETHRGNLATVQWLSRYLPRPCFTGSTYVTVYRRLPNDTDFSVFSADGWTGLNFAFIGDTQNYHTRNDNLAHLDWRSVQHHGENALSLARAIVDSDEIDLQASAEDAVFFDLLGTWVIYWPQSWAWPLGAIAFVILAVSGARRLRTRAGIRAAWRTLLAMLVTAILSAALGWVLGRNLSVAGLLPTNHVTHGRWLAALYWPLSFAILRFAVRYLVQDVSREDVWATYWLVWSLAALAIAWWIPGFSYLFLVPALAAATCAVVPLGWTAKFVLSVGVAGIMLLPLGNMLPIVFGPGAGIMLCSVVTLALSPLFPGFVVDSRVAPATASAAT